jgi:glycosyltransferase involved in cell wall biosynthesis
MNIAWCTPFATRSRIGEFSAAVVTELRRHSSTAVDILYAQGAGGRTLPDPGMPLGDDAAEQLLAYDAVIYNIGNHSGYHGDLVELANRVPGILIVHDISLTHLMRAGLMQLTEPELIGELVRRYGPHGRQMAEMLRSDEPESLWNAEDLEALALLSFVVDNALAVVTHSRFAAERVKREYAGDVWVLPLPASHVAEEGSTAEPATLDRRPLVLQAGMLNTTKCVPTVIEAFAMADVAERAQLVICGFALPAYVNELRQQVASWRIEQSVQVTGGVSNDILDSLRRQATVATVLRYPIGEASSAVLLDSMAYGLGVITVDFGHYAEMPDDTVLRIDYPPSPEQLSQAIRSAIDEPAKTAEMGARAQQYVRTHHTAAHYADGILEVIKKAGSLGRRRNLATDLAHTIERTGFDSDDPISEIVANTAVDLFGNKPVMAHEIFGE